MCGIAGFLDQRNHFKQAESISIVKKMGSAIAYRGPDSCGTWMNAEQKIFFAHQRLAILDLTKTGHQPMKSFTSRYCITYNGEIYNHLELRLSLKNDFQFNSWNGSSDTETLLVLIEHYGLKKTLSKLQGMFAFAIWDEVEKKLFICRDRFGEKPVYISHPSNHESFFIFGSELSALIEHPKFDPVINQEVLNQYTQLGYVPRSKCIFSGVSKVKPGTFISIDPNNMEIKEFIYWDSAREAMKSHQEKFHGNFQEASDELESLLIKKVANQMISDVPLGSFLSGGIDSSLVTAIMQSISSQPIQTFTIGFDEAEWDESSHAADVARAIGTNHSEERVTFNEAISIIPRLSEIYSEPFADASQIPTHVVSKSAKKDVVVALTGDAGDEIFCGYDRYQINQKLWNIIKFFPSSIVRMISNKVAIMPLDQIDTYFKMLSKIAPTLSRIARPADKLKKGLKLLDNSSFNSLYVNSQNLWSSSDNLFISDKLDEGLIEMDQLSKSLNNVEKAMLFDTLGYLTDDILVKVDRAAMSVSLETRAPFLDHEVFNFAWSLPLSYKLKSGNSKRILKNILYKYVDRSLLERPKMGFGVPVGEWIKGPLREWAEDLLNTDIIKAEGYFCPNTIQKFWEEHKNGDRNWQNQLWTILMFQSWHRDFFNK
tara:strand:- start:812 stop:2779 length:1968 start_codon:yes stop_codon:yes gene_type:complete